MKNILIVSPFGHIGGAEISILSMITNLERQKFNPIVVCYEDGPFVEKIRSSGIEVHVFHRKSVFSNLIIVFKIIKLIHSKKIDIVHVNSFDIRAGITAWLSKTPLIGHLRVIFPFSRIDSIFVSLANHIISVSEAARDFFTDKFPGKQDKFIIIPNPVRIPPEGTKSSIKKELGVADDHLLIGAVGRIDRWKGYEYFIQAIPRVLNEFPNTYFLIVGGVSEGYQEGEEYQQYLFQLRTESGLKKKLILTGYREDSLSTISELDILVVPSVELLDHGQVKTEGFGRVAIEAMALRTPVIASRVGGLSEIIDHDINGILISPESPEAIAESVIKILKNKSLKKQMIQNAYQKYLDCYTIDRHITNIQNLYLSILDS